MSAPLPNDRPLRTFHAFCSLLLPGLGQMLQRRWLAAVGNFSAFCLMILLPVSICLAAAYQNGVFDNKLIFTVALVYGIMLLLPVLLLIFFSVLDAATGKQGTKFRFTSPLLTVIILYFFVLLPVVFGPAVSAANESARWRQCQNNMRQLALALQIYCDVHGHFPPAYTVDEAGKPLHSWRVLILPYLEDQGLYAKIRLDEPWDSEYNKQFHSAMPSYFQCPSSRSLPVARRKSVSLGKGCTYSVVVGAETAFPGAKGLTEKEIGDGLSDTIFLVERLVPMNWMDPNSEMAFETACKGVDAILFGIGSCHPKGSNVAFGDGNVRRRPSETNAEELKAMLTANGRE